MSQLTRIAQVARWEFLRYFKIKDFALTFFLIVGIMVGVEAFTQFASKPEVDEVTIGIVGEEHMPFEAGKNGRFLFRADGASEDQLRGELQDKKIDGILVFRSPDQADLIVRSQVGWREALGNLLTEWRRNNRLKETGVSALQLADLVSPFAMSLRYADESRAASASPTGVAIMIGLMLMGLFVGMSYLFVGITGEKTQRVTEQIVAALPPQTWIDGKIVGLSFLVFVSILVYAASFIAAAGANALLFGEEFEVPQMIADPGLFVAVLLLALLGFFLWFTFFALIASTINDPNTSARSVFLFLPILTLGAAFAGIQNPDAVWMKVMGFFPPTAPTVMSVRMVLGEVAMWELPLTLALMTVTILLLRRAAGKVFSLGMLMYGKEPSFVEMVRWVREPETAR